MTPAEYIEVLDREFAAQDVTLKTLESALKGCDPGMTFVVPDDTLPSSPERTRITSAGAPASPLSLLAMRA
jgi:hypothetical protein